MSPFLSAAISAIASGLVAAGIATILAVAFDRRFAGVRGVIVKRVGDPTPPRESSLTASWPVALVLLAGFIATYRVCLDKWPPSPFSDDPLIADERIFWAVIVFAAAAVFDSLPRIPAFIRLCILLAALSFAVRYVLGSLIADVTGFRGVMLTSALMFWLLLMRAGLDVSTRHGSWKPFDAVILAVAIGFMGAALAGSGSFKLGQLAWGLCGAAGAVAIGIMVRRVLPTAPSYATVLALSLGSLLMLGVYASSTPWYAAVLVSLAPGGRFLARVGPLADLKGPRTLAIRALLVLAPAALGAGLAIAATTTTADLAL